MPALSPCSSTRTRCSGGRREANDSRSVLARRSTPPHPSWSARSSAWEIGTLIAKGRVGLDRPLMHWIDTLFRSGPHRSARTHAADRGTGVKPRIVPRRPGRPHDLCERHVPPLPTRDEGRKRSAPTREPKGTSGSSGRSMGPHPSSGHPGSATVLSGKPTNWSRCSSASTHDRTSSTSKSRDRKGRSACWYRWHSRRAAVRVPRRGRRRCRAASTGSSSPFSTWPVTRRRRSPTRTRSRHCAHRSIGFPESGRPLTLRGRSGQLDAHVHGPGTAHDHDVRWTPCNEVYVRIAGGPTATRQGNDALRAQLTELIS